MCVCVCITHTHCVMHIVFHTLCGFWTVWLHCLHRALHMHLTSCDKAQLKAHFKFYEKIHWKELHASGSPLEFRCRLTVVAPNRRCWFGTNGLNRTVRLFANGVIATKNRVLHLFGHLGISLFTLHCLLSFFRPRPSITDCIASSAYCEHFVSTWSAREEGMPRRSLLDFLDHCSVCLRIQAKSFILNQN